MAVETVRRRETVRLISQEFEEWQLETCASLYYIRCFKTQYALNGNDNTIFTL